MKDAVKFAKSLDDRRTASLCYCNLGVIEGEMAYERYMEEESQKLLPDFLDDK